MPGLLNYKFEASHEKSGFLCMFSLHRKYNLSSYYVKKSKPVAIFCDCTAQIWSDLVGNPRGKFSRIRAHLTFVSVTMTWHEATKVSGSCLGQRASLMSPHFHWGWQRLYQHWPCCHDNSNDGVLSAQDGCWTHLLLLVRKLTVAGFTQVCHRR